MDWVTRAENLGSTRGTRSEPERFAELMEIDWLRILDEHPEGATFAGVQGYDDRWTDLSPEAHERRRRQARAVAEAARSIDRDALSVDDRLNLDLFTQQAEIRDESMGFPGELMPLGTMSGPQHLIPRTISLTRAPEDALARLEAAPAVIEQTIELLREGLRRGITTPRIVISGVAEQLDAQIADPATGPILAGATHLTGSARSDAEQVIGERIVPAFETLRAFVTDEYEPATRESIGLSELPDGEAWYAFEARRYTTTDLSPKEIHEIGLSEVERIRAEMADAKRATGHSGSFEEFFEFLRTDDGFFFDSAEELLASYRDLAKRADPKLAELFSVLPRTPYGVEPVPAHEEQHVPTAYYLRGALHAGRAGTFYANTYDLRSRPRWEMEALTLHEAVPGHHLQVSIGQELGDVPEFRKHARFTAFVEGWGLYAESLGTEMGFYTDPYSRFGQLTYEMWRAIRLVVDTGMHAFGWSREQAIELFRTNAGKADHDITVEVDRYIAWPGQALAYKLGELKFKELRARATAALGDRFDVRAFHDELLSRAALPLDILESLIDDWIAQRGASS